LLFIIATFTEVIITDYSLEQVTLVDIPEKPLVFLNMGYPLKKESKSKITWKEYISSKTEERYEVIDGEIYDTEPDILGHDEVLKLTLHDIEIPLTEIFE